MSDFDDAVQRLTAWLRDFGDSKPRVFIGDLSIVLLAARDTKRQQAEIERLRAFIESHAEEITLKMGSTPVWRIHGVVGRGATIWEAIEAAKAGGKCD